MSAGIVLLINLAATLYMTGVIWFVQIVHYPLFGKVGVDGYSTYHTSHTNLTGFVVAPPMLVELATALMLTVHPPHALPIWMPWAGVALVGFLWLSTFLLQVPRHNTLGGGFDPAAHRFLVTSNWLRTVGWTARAFLLLWAASRLIKA